jgi:hypothetical protein
MRPPVAVTISFIDCINRADVDSLAALMTDDHRLCVFDEAPLAGKAANVEAWRGYATSWPDYVIYPERISAPADDLCAVLGHTTGSHLGLPDEIEVEQTLIWLARVAGDAVREWRLVEDTAVNRSTYELD